ncbi:hypothetical protein CDD81_4698 [Ophiocordyceps australis]|uniref:M protein repeat protein n=1 Tax=Ophiocordyceps australis TaxID=1399860 RepID=A0A2C5YBU1_9HYPO|nr:hypothetical protein CDD81_4698 [Ophiocordyceps australis]
MADAEEKARQEKLAAARKRVEEMKKKKLAKEAATKKDDSPSDAADKPPEIPAPDEATAVDDEAAADESEAPCTPSLAQQSKLRSTSFRSGPGLPPISPGLVSPDGSSGDTAADIYRKHVARIEELERDNKRMAKETADAERRWKKLEEELSDLREAENTEVSAKPTGDDAQEKLKNEIASLQRQNAQLQQQVSRGSGHRPSVSVASPPSELQADLDSKTATIEQMEMELSKLKAKVERQETSSSTEREQVTALEEKLARAEAAAGKAQRELADVKRNLERATEKAVKEGSQRSSAETRVQTLETELEQLRSAKSELEIRADALEKKAATLTTLHKEHDARCQTLRKDKDKAEKEAGQLGAKVDKLESENSRLRSRKSTDGGLDDEGVDELEDEERKRMQTRIRSLEHQVHELRSGAWIEKRREMESMGAGFQDVDLTGSNSFASPGHKKPSGGGFGDFFTSGLNALAGTTAGGNELLDDDDLDFDEDAFRRAHEEEARNRIERIKEIKRSLKHWEGWRLDIVDMRRGGGEGIGDIFEV